jgi:hypothetical protein
VVSETSTTTLKPEFRNVAIASAREKLVTSGTDDSAGPLETNNVTVEPGAISEFAGGVHLDDDSLRVVRLDVPSRDPRSPRPAARPAADSNGDPTTGGTPTGFGPCETLNAHLLALQQPACPTFGNWPVTMPESFSEWT